MFTAFLQALPNAIAFSINAHQAGFNMIPQLGWKQAVEAWAASKVTK